MQQSSAKSRLKRKASDDVEMVPASLLESTRKKNSELAGQVHRLEAEISRLKKNLGGSGETDLNIRVDKKDFEEVKSQVNDVRNKLVFLEMVIMFSLASHQQPSTKA